MLLAALAAPPLTLMFAWTSADAGAAASAQPVEYLLESSARTVTVGAKAEAVWDEPVAVRAPAWNGLVTQVLVEVGQQVTGGTPIARVNGVEVRHQLLPEPLYRTVCQGDTAQVAEVRAVLQAAGLPSASAQRLNARDVASIRKYAQAIGVDGWRDLTCFDPSWITVSAAPVPSVSKVELAVGAPAPAQGELVLTSTPTLAALTIMGDSGAESIDAHLSSEGAAKFGGSELIINGKPTGTGLTDLADAAALASVATLMKAPSDATAEGETANTSASEASAVAVMLSLRDTQYVVPATAVVEPLGPAPCVVDAKTGSTTPATVIASSVSGLIVEFGAPPAVGSSVLIAPGDASCA